MFIIPNFKKYFCLTLVVLVVLGFFINTKANWDTNSYQSQKQLISEESQRLDLEIEKYTKDLHSSGQLSLELSTELKTLESEIQEIDRILVENRVLLGQIEKEILQKEKQIADIQKNLEDTIRKIQKQSLVSPIQTILGAKNLSSVLSRLSGLSQVGQKISELETNLQKEKQDLDELKSSQQDILSQVEKIKAIKANRKSTIEDLLSKTNGDQQKYQEIIKTLSDQTIELENRQAIIDSEYQNKEKSSSNINPVYGKPAESIAGCKNGVKISGESINLPNNYFTEPTKGFISQGITCTHDGLDIANSSGTEIYAAADGKVVKKGFQYGGYGNFLAIEHVYGGRKFITVYAHLLSQAKPAVGDIVKKSELIGYMGSTGLSTGPHLHFSIIAYYDGSLGCNPVYGGTSSCFNPRNSPFNLY